MRWVLLAGVMAGMVSCKSSVAMDGGMAAPAPTPKGMCDDVDDTNLQAVAECMYRAKTEADQWRLLSRALQQEDGAPSDAGTFTSDGCEVSDIKITKQETVTGNVFAAVSRTVRCPKTDGGTGCSDRATRTWSKEGTAWRLHGGSRQAKELTKKKFNAGDYWGAAASAEEWLKIDPFSVDAYDRLGFSVVRGARVRSTADIARAVMGIDATNSSALFLALTLSSNADVRENYLRKLAPDDCALPGAVSNVAVEFIAESRAEEALALLDRYPQFESNHRDRRIEALAMLKRWSQVVEYLTEPVRRDLMAKFDDTDPTYAAIQSGMIASALLSAGRPDLAREWIDYGLLRDPTNADLGKLLRKLKK